MHIKQTKTIKSLKLKNEARINLIRTYIKSKETSKEYEIRMT